MEESKDQSGNPLGKYTMSLQFPSSEYPNADGEACLDSIKKLEAKVKADAMTYSKDWFGKTITNAEVMDEKFNIEVTRKSWPIHTSSCTDPNVMNALKGLVLHKRLLLQKDLETYASIILHLKQANIKINLQYDLIQQYLDENNFINQSNILDLSNNEKKFIENNIQGYQLNLPE